MGYGNLDAEQVAYLRRTAMEAEVGRLAVRVVGLEAEVEALHDELSRADQAELERVRSELRDERGRADRLQAELDRNRTNARYVEEERDSWDRDVTQLAAHAWPTLLTADEQAMARSWMRIQTIRALKSRFPTMRLKTAKELVDACLASKPSP